jgi:hypothetical protein
VRALISETSLLKTRTRAGGSKGGHTAQYMEAAKRRQQYFIPLSTLNGSIAITELKIHSGNGHAKALFRFFTWHTKVSAKESLQTNRFFVAWLSVPPPYFVKNRPSIRMKFGVLVAAFFGIRNGTGF